MFLTITIRGLAFCSVRSTDTQILLPHAPGHELAVSYIDDPTGPKPLQLSAIENTLNLKLNGTANAPNLTSSQNNDLLPLGEWHRQAGSLLKFKRRIFTGSEMRVSLLTVPTNKIYSDRPTVQEFEIWSKHRGSSGEPKLKYRGRPQNHIEPNKLAEYVKFRFEIPANSPIQLMDVDKATELHAFDGSAETELIFDNHCLQPFCPDDFGYYYEMLESTDKKNRSVEIQEFPLRIPFADVAHPTSEASCNPVQGDTKCDLDDWRKGRPLYCPIS